MSTRTPEESIKLLKEEIDYFASRIAWCRRLTEEYKADAKRYKQIAAYAEAMRLQGQYERT
ncbi:MAG: hypothetical protein V3R81_06585 [Gammaproteobacteria bacterium]